MESLSQGLIILSAEGDLKDCKCQFFSQSCHVTVKLQRDQSDGLNGLQSQRVLEVVENYRSGPDALIVSRLTRFLYI